MNNIYYLFSVKDHCFTDLSLIIKKNKPNSLFYGMAYAKSPVLKNKIYSHISYISDVINKNGAIDYAFLEGIEKTYDVNVSSLIHTDRHLLRFAKKNRLYVAQELLRLFIHEMNEFKIATIVVEGIDDFISVFASTYSKHHGIKLIFPTYVGYSGRTCLTGHVFAEPDDFREKFSEFLPLVKKGEIDVTQVENEIVRYANSRKRPSYMGSPDASYRAFRVKDFKVFFQYLSNYLHDRNGIHYEWNPLLIPFYRVQKILRKKRYHKFLSQEGLTDTQSLKNMNYLIYPLHFEPESSTLIQGRWFNDQRKIIEMISKSMPINTVLLVKEHMPSIGRRPLNYYKDVACHHNVFFIDHRVDTYSLIEGSKGVIAISSTMGIEALMLKKPVMTFGERFYNVSNNVYKITNFRTIDAQITAMINHEFDWLDALAFFYTLFQTSEEDMGFLSSFDYSHEDLHKLAHKVEVFLTK